MREEMLAAVKDSDMDIRRFFRSLSEHTRNHSRCVAALTEILLNRAVTEGLLEDEPLPLPTEQIRHQIASNSKTQFDPDLADIFIKYEAEIYLSEKMMRA